MTKKQLTIKVFADCTDIEKIAYLAENPIVKGFTTNPSLMRKSGVTDYKEFCLKVLSIIGDKPVSFEVFSDDFSEMERQAREIASWGDNIYVKIPIINTKGFICNELIWRLTGDGIKCNITAIFTQKQIQQIKPYIYPDTKTILSYFAGRVADTGRRIDISNWRDAKPKCELLWASSRQLYDAIEAQNKNFDIITMTPDLISKFNLFNKDLDQFSLETVKMFYEDAKASGYNIEV